MTLLGVVVAFAIGPHGGFPWIIQVILLPGFVIAGKLGSLLPEVIQDLPEYGSAFWTLSILLQIATWMVGGILIQRIRGRKRH